jgi:S1-C subfamily serine protease
MMHRKRCKKACIIVALAVSLILRGKPGLAEETPAQKLLDGLRPAVPIITAIATETKSQRQGTGLVVSGDLVLTNKHVVTDANMLIVRFQDLPTDIYLGSVIARHPSRDLAAVRLTKAAGNRPTVSFANDVIRPGTPIVATGYSTGLVNWGHHEGTIEGDSTYNRLVLSEEDNLLANGQYGQPDDRVYIINQIPPMPGLSGAPIFDFERRCVGLMTGAKIIRLADSDGNDAAVVRPFCIDGIDAKEFLDDLSNPAYQPDAQPTAKVGSGIVPLTAPERESSGIVVAGDEEVRAEWEPLSTLRIAEVEAGGLVPLNDQIANLILSREERRFPGGGIVSNSVAHYSMAVPKGWNLREEMEPDQTEFRSIYTKKGVGEVRVSAVGIPYPWLYQTTNGQLGNDPVQMLQINVINHRRNSLMLWLNDHNRTDAQIPQTGRSIVQLGRLSNKKGFGDAYFSGDSVFRYRHYEAVRGRDSWFCLCLIKWNVFLCVDFKFETTALQPHGVGRANFVEMMFFPLSLSTTE